MKPLKNLGRNDVIRIVALVSVVAFPLIADAQLGLGSKAAKISNAIAPVAEASAKASAPGDACANQHWPYLSAECLRGSTPVKPRLVSMSSEPAPHRAVMAVSTPAQVTHAATAHDNAPIAKPKRPLKPKVATHKRQRTQPSVTYAASSPPAQISLAGW